MNKDEKYKLWSDRIQEYQSSGQSCKAWCLEHQISLSTMTYWIRMDNVGNAIKLDVR